MQREMIFSSAAPTPGGAYSQAIKVGNTIYVSGQIPIDMTTGIMATEGVHKETRIVLTNILNILIAVGASFGNIVKFTIYLKEIGDIRFVDEVLRETFGNVPLPARVTIQVSALPKGARIEIDAIAVI
ncbi:MAG: Rid family detoxifying hydrolase [bacterium]